MRIAWVILPWVWVAACAGGDPYQNYASWMQEQVGKNVNAPDAYRNRYPSNLARTRRLANGHIEEEYRRGRGGRCPTYFEIDDQSKTIVAWRHEGTKEDCGIVP